MNNQALLLSTSNVKLNDLNELEVTKAAYEPCNPINDFRNNGVIFVLACLSIGAILVLGLSCLFAYCKYRKLKGQYYERVNLIKSSNNTRSSDIGISPDNSGRGGGQNR